MNYLLSQKDAVIKHPAFFFTIASMFLLFFTASNSFGMGGGGGLNCGDNGYTSMPNNGSTSAQDPTTLCVNGSPLYYTNSDVDGDGCEDVDYSVENNTFFTFTGPAGSGCVSYDFIMTPDANQSIQATLFPPNSNTCGCTGLDGANSVEDGGGVNSDGDIITLTVTICEGDTWTLMVDGYAGDDDGGFNTTVICDCIPPVVSAVGSPLVVCSGELVDLTASGASTYSWTASGGGGGLNSTTGSAVTANPTTTTTYTVTGDDGAGCTGTAEVTVTVTAPPVADAGGDIIMCEGTGPVTIGADPINGTEGLPYSWDNGAGSGTLDLSGGGQDNGQVDVDPAATTTYTVTVGSGSCVDTDQMTVTVNPAPDAGTDGAIILCTSDATTDLFDELGGTPDAGGTWSGPSGLGGGDAGTFDPATMSAGTYTYTVTAAGCPDATAEVVVTLDMAPDAGLDGAITYCSSDASSDLFDELGGTPDTGGSWSGPSGLGGGDAGTFDPSSMLGGTYIYTVLGSGTCPDATAEVVVTLIPAPTPDAGLDISVCAETTVTIGADPVYTVEGATYSWDNSAGSGTLDLSGGGQDHGQVDVTPLTTTTYILTVTDGVCSATDDIEITVLPIPLITPQLDLVACDSLQLPAISGTLTGNEGFYSGTGGTGTAYSTGDWISTSMATIYIYDETMTLPNCFDEVSFAITITPSPGLTVQDTATCSPNTIDLTDVTYWSTDVGTITFFESDGITAVGDETAVGAGTYIIAADNAGCITSLPVVVTVNATPVLTVQDTTTCSPNTVDLTDGAYWSTDVGTITFFESDGITAVGDETAVGAGTYIIAADNAGCITSLPVVVTVNATPVLTVQDTTTCSPNTVDLTDGAYWSTDVGTITFFESDGITAVGDETAVGAGTYILSADNSGCISTAIVVVIVIPLPVFTVQDTTTCSPNTVSLIDFTYWSTDIGVITYFEANGTTIIADPTTVGAGTYILSSNNLGCIATAPVVVTVNASPVIAAAGLDPALCNTVDGEIEVTLSSGPTSLGVLAWAGSASGTNGSADITVDSPDINGLGAGSYNVTFTDANGCVSNTELIVLNNPFAPIIDPISSIVSCAAYDLALANVTGANINTSGALSFYSLTGGPSAPGQQVIIDQTFTAFTDTTIFVYDENGACSAEIQFNITINTTPTLTVQDTTTCSPSSVDLTDVTYWSTDVGTITFFESDGITPVLNPTTVGAGTYVLSANNLSCITSAPVVVTANTTPTLIVQDTTTCSPNTIDLTDVAYWSTDVGTITFFESDGITVVGDETAVGAGTYILSADSLGCITTEPLVLTVTPLPVLTVQDTAICSPNTVDLTDATYWSTDIGVITYFEADGTTTVADETAVGAGTYILSADNAGCITTAPVVLTVTPLPVLTVQDTTTCSPNTINLTDPTYWSTGVGTITYFESDGTTVVGDETIVGAGTYILSADNAGCVTTAPVILTVNTTPLILAVGSDPLTCNATDGEIEVTLSAGSTSSGVLDWTGTASGTNGSADITTDSPDITDLGAGSYNVTFTDVNGCISNTELIGLNNPFAPIIDPISSIVSCADYDLVLASVTGTNINTTGALAFYALTGGPLVVGQQVINDQTFTAFSDTTIFVYDQSGVCSHEIQYSITINTTPTLTVQDTTTCSPSTVNLTDGAYWSTDTGVITYFESDGTTVVGDATAVGAGTYILSADNAGCITTAPVVVTVNTTPMLSVQDTTTCSPSTIDLTDVAYWSTDVGTITYFESDGTTVVGDETIVGAGTYILSADNVGCITIAPVVVTVNLLPILTYQDTTTCSANTIDLTDVTYWTVDLGTITYFESDGTTLVGDATAVGAGTYILSADNAGCITTAPVVVTVNTTPTLTLNNPAAICSPATVDITTGALSSTDVGTVLYYSDAAMTMLVSDATAVGGGTYYVEATNLGCTSNGSITVIVNITPILTLNDPAAVCSPLTVDIAAGNISSTNIGTVLYYSDVAMTILVPDATAVGSGTYYVEATSLGCTSNGSVTVTVVTTPDVDPQMPVVECDSYALPIITGTALSGAQNYFDATGGPSVANVVTGPITSSTTLYVYDGASGCSDEEALVITINPLPTVTLVSGGDTYCQGDVVSDILVDVTGTASFTVDYTLDGAALSATGATNQLSLGNAAGVYIITNITDGNTCSNGANGSQTIVVNPIPAAPVAGVDAQYCSTVTPNAMTASGGFGTFTWYSDAGLTSVLGTGSTFNPSTALGAATYYVTETEFGCEGPASQVNISIVGCEITVPTAFTPDGDGMNDDWEIVDLDLTYPNNIVYVYNRWGNLLFTSEQGSYDARRWDGTYKEELLPIGSYYFIIEFNDKENDKATGIVSIILNK